MSAMDIGEHPFAVMFRGNFVQVLVPVSVMALFGVWMVYDHSVVNKHYTDGEQCGTAA